MSARRFVLDGPAIPADVLHALDEDRLVFFCGAGISVGSGLPDFRDLVSDAYAQCRQPLDRDRRPTDPAVRDAYCREQYDKALEILERGEGERRGPMRRAVMRRLLEPPEGDPTLPVHRALLALSRRRAPPTDEAGYRLVTTNFDDRFECAGLPRPWIEQGPRLGRPRPEGLRKVVHLHGRIEWELPEDSRQLFDLVLTSADFGNAYLREAWAARFVVELFREFTVLFVGYGLNDPVMRYLLDALATESHPGGQFKPAFALASHKILKKGDHALQEALWKAKNVTPILYAADHPGKERHALLAETLVAWADEHGAGLSGRLATALGIARRPYVPGASEGGELDEVAAVAWALSDPSGNVARRFAEAEPSPDISWLAPVAASQVRDPARPTRTCPLLELEAVRPSLATWVCRNLAREEAVEWVAGREGRLFPELTVARNRAVDQGQAAAVTPGDYAAAVAIYRLEIPLCRPATAPCPRPHVPAPEPDRRPFWSADRPPPVVADRWPCH
jgi:hypothetical protein